MKYELLFLMLLLSVSIQGKDRFSDKVNIKKFTKEYWKIDRNKTNVEKSKTNILNLVEKFSDKYNVDLKTSDTIFILETCSVESMTCYGSLWSQKETVNFRFYKKLNFTSHNIFETEEIKALFKWNKDIFKSLDEEGRLWLPSNTRYATRIIIYNGTINIDRVDYQH
jgi:hypothetical protein